jgi:hypothetical protein
LVTSGDSSSGPGTGEYCQDLRKPRKSLILAKKGGDGHGRISDRKILRDLSAVDG